MPECASRPVTGEGCVRANRREAHSEGSLVVCNGRRQFHVGARTWSDLAGFVRELRERTKMILTES